MAVRRQTWRAALQLCILFWVGAGMPQGSRAQQTPGTVSQDPLLGLMLAQPRIDVDSPVVPTAKFEPAVVRPGQEAVYRLTFNALEACIKLPPKLVVIPAGETRATARGQLLVLTGTNYQPRTCFNYRVRPPAPGIISIPPFTVNVYGKNVTVPAAELRVAANPPPGTPAAQALKLQLSQTNVYVGQAVHASVALPPATSLVLQHSSPLQVNGQGFIIDPNSLRPRMETRMLGGGNNAAPSLVYDVVLMPIAPGKTTALAQAFVTSRAVQPFTPAPGGVLTVLPQYTLLDSEAVEFTVMPLPREGQLPGFTGAVGHFSSDPPQLATNVLRVGDPVKLSVRIRGDGNLARLVAPEPPRSGQWRLFQSEPNPTHPQIIQAQGFTVFTYTLVPLTVQARETPSIPFSCFAPDEGRYLDCTIESVPVTVLPGSVPTDLEVVQQADAVGMETREKEPVLSGLAASPGLGAASLIPLQRQIWFPILQLTPGLAFLGLWVWDRRRRYFEAHPGVLLRKRARRALRKQCRAIRRASARKDALAFSRAAVRALDIACSPFYPADPRALVGADVLALLSDAERSGPEGQAVRELFAFDDAARFSRQGRAPGPVLKLEPQLNSLLQSLDHKLRV